VATLLVSFTTQQIGALEETCRNLNTGLHIQTEVTLQLNNYDSIEEAEKY
jgi:hypothetical protein